MLSFPVSISALGLVQAAIVALPRVPLPELPRPIRVTSRWWALVPAMSIVLVILVVNFYADSARALSWLALVAVPPLAALALGLLIKGARSWFALFALPLLAVAWAAIGSLSGDLAATALSGLACVALGWLLVSVVPPLWLRLGVYAMAAVDTWLVASDLLQGPNSVLTAAAPGAELPRLQVVHLGSARMGFGDLFVAGVVGCLLAGSRRQAEGAVLVAVLALAFDLLFFAVDTLPATLPVAVALALTQRSARRAAPSARRGASAQL